MILYKSTENNYCVILNGEELHLFELDIDTCHYEGVVDIKTLIQFLLTTHVDACKAKYNR